MENALLNFSSFSEVNFLKPFQKTNGKPKSSILLNWIPCIAGILMTSIEQSCVELQGFVISKTLVKSHFFNKKEKTPEPSITAQKLFSPEFFSDPDEKENLQKASDDDERALTKKNKQNWKALLTFSYKNVVQNIRGRPAIKLLSNPFFSVWW